MLMIIEDGNLIGLFREPFSIKSRAFTDRDKLFKFKRIFIRLIWLKIRIT